MIDETPQKRPHTPKPSPYAVTLAHEASRGRTTIRVTIRVRYAQEQVHLWGGRDMKRWGKRGVLLAALVYLTTLVYMVYSAARKTLNELLRQ